MTPSEYQELAARTMSPDILNENMDLACHAMGLSGEAGEVTDYLKKCIFHGHKFDKDILVKELGDVMWYIAALCTTEGVTLEEVMEKNIEKLLIRYPKGFTHEDSRKRVDQ